MTVYVVVEEFPYEQGRVIGVFSELEAANRCALKWQGENDYPAYDVLPFVVDQNADPISG